MYQLPEDYLSVVETFQTKLGSAVCEINARQVANGDSILSLSDLLFVS